MSTATQTATQTTTVTAGDVRKVMAEVSAEIHLLLDAFASLAPDFEADDAMVDIALLALNDVVSVIQLQVYTGDELIREYAYRIAEGSLPTQGPPPTGVPIGPVPQGARIRLAVIPNPQLAPGVRDDWLRRLGWIEAEALSPPPGARYQTYGTFASGGYGLERQLLVNPKYDRPVNPTSGGSPMRKGP